MFETDITAEISLIKHLWLTRELKYKDFISWVGSNYELDLFKTVMHECTSISDGMDILLTEYHPYDFPEEFWLSKIAEDHKEQRVNLQESVLQAYNLLNRDGFGKHDLSILLYRLVDDYSDETMREYLLRIKQSNFENILQNYNLNQWTLLNQKVFRANID